MRQKYECHDAISPLAQSQRPIRSAAGLFCRTTGSVVLLVVIKEYYYHFYFNFKGSSQRQIIFQVLEICLFLHYCFPRRELKRRGAERGACSEA